MAQPSAHDPKAYVANATPKIQEFLKRYQKPGTITTTGPLSYLCDDAFAKRF